ncbi:MAG TPA: cell wall hydrolase, partial [Candidatus Paceibacterota bacterium]
MTLTDHDIDVMSRTIYGEARGEQWDGQVAVGWVIRNRLEDSAKRYGKTIAEVCQKPYQFSCWLKSDPNLIKLVAVTPADTAFRSCLAATAWALSGIGGDLTHG